MTPLCLPLPKAARYIGMSPQYIKKQILTGKLPARQSRAPGEKGRNDYFILVEDLQAWFKSLKKVKGVQP